MALVYICNDDRISKLPDDILTHILSFIPTKFSVRTRVLSKRWKQLSSLVPVLEFFCPDGDFGAMRRFIRFVNWVFNTYNVDQMDRFSYKSYNDLPVPSPLNFWISEALRRGVRELDVYELCQRYTLSCCVFTCDTLTDLKIHGKFDLEVPENACLPNVKTLHLLDVRIFGDCSVSRLLQSCPSLEDLSIEFRMKKKKEVLYISIPTLKSLKMRLYGHFELLLNVPNVEYVDFSGDVAYEFSAVQQYGSLYKALIKLWDCSVHQVKVIGKLVSMLCHVRHLCLTSDTLKDFQKTGLSLPTFRNLVHLEITVYTKRFDLGLLLGLLGETPRLEILVVDNFLQEDDKSDQLGRLLAAENVPECVSLHLKKVEFLGSFMENDCLLVEFILKNAQVLETLKIMGTDDEGNHFREKVKTFPRCSRDCQIILAFDTDY